MDDDGAFRRWIMRGNNDGFLAGGSTGPLADLVRAENEAGTWPDEKSVDAAYRRFLRAFQTAATPLAARGWQVYTSRAVWRSPESNWARIHVFKDGWIGALRMHIQVDLYSAALLRVVDRGTPDVEPKQPRWPAHLHPFSTVVSFTPRRGAADPRRAPTLDRSVEAETRNTLVDPDTVGPWLAELLGRLADAAETWVSSDLALRDALVAASHPWNVMALRHAAILSWLMGDQEGLGDLVAEAGARAAEGERQEADDAARSGYPPRDPHEFDRSRSMLLWSHQRFVRFLERDLPKRVEALR